MRKILNSTEEELEFVITSSKAKESKIDEVLRDYD